MSRLLPCASLCALVAVTAGCGGVSAPVRTSRATLTIVWPTRSRLIPAAANSLRVALKQGEASLGERLVARPANGTSSTVFFDRLPGGAATATATAYPQADGSGVALATATVPLTLTLGQNTDFTLTMASTIDHLDLSVPASPMTAGATGAAAVAARDSAGAAVPLTASKLQWISTDPTVATVDSAGVVTAVSLGTATIRVSDTESLRVAEASVRVVPRIVLNATAATLSVGDTKTFTATVTGATNKAVTWSVAENGGGTVTAAGLYTAPAVAGVYHVVAASQADPTQKATATVTVQSGSASGTIQ